jgi:dTDP-4-dehydrorhamnose reductase
MIPILLTGAKGQLGSEIGRLSSKYKTLQILNTDLEELDIRDEEAIKRILDKHPSRFIINCAAYTAVDKAEDEPNMAFALNSEAVAKLARIADERNIQLIHISTDYVFDGRKNTPYHESDVVNPESVYGKSKLEGEHAILDINKGIIIRTSWLYSIFGHNFVKTILKLSLEREQLNVVFDQTGCPTNARDLASQILQMIMRDSENARPPRFDLYHYSNEGLCSWYEFAKAILEQTSAKCKILPIESKDYITRAVRPRYSGMSKEKIRHDYHIKIPHWKESMKNCLNELTAK